MSLSIPTMWQFPEIFLMFLPLNSHKETSKIPDIPSLDIYYFSSFRPIDMVGKACLPSYAYYPWMPDYTLSFGVHVCSSEHSGMSVIHGFMS